MPRLRTVIRLRCATPDRSRHPRMPLRLRVVYFTKHLRVVRVTAQHDGGVGSMTTIATSAAVTRCRCATTPAPSSRTARRVASVSPLASPAGTSPRLNGQHRTRRSPAPPAALPPFLDTIPAFLATPSPGLVPAAAANTAVFTGGIKVLLKGLTWPGVINSWFLGTVSVASSRLKRPFRCPSFPIYRDPPYTGSFLRAHGT